MKVKMKLFTDTTKKDFVKEFKDLQYFNDFKSSRLDNNVRSITYSILHDNANVYTKPVTEYGVKRSYSSKNITRDSKSKNRDNTIQKTSRNNHLALVGNDLINLNMTPSKQKKLVKWMDSGVPITSGEKKLVKGLFLFDKLSVSQYQLLDEIQRKVSRRVKLVK